MDKINQPDIPYLYKLIADLQATLGLLLTKPPGHIIEDELGAYPARSKLKYIGIGKRITDDPIDDTTQIDVSSPAIIGQIVMDVDGSIYDVVTVDGQLADSSNINNAGRVAGIATAAPATGFPVDVIFNGLIDNPAWNWNQGDVLFLNGTTLSTTPPVSGFIQMIGSAQSPTTVLINIEEPILL